MPRIPRRRSQYERKRSLKGAPQSGGGFSDTNKAVWACRAMEVLGWVCGGLTLLSTLIVVLQGSDAPPLSVILVLLVGLVSAFLVWLPLVFAARIGLTIVDMKLVSIRTLKATGTSAAASRSRRESEAGEP